MGWGQRTESELTFPYLRLLQLGLQVRHVEVAVPHSLGFAQPDAVDDTGVVQLVADNRVLRRENGLKESRVGVKATRVQDGGLWGWGDGEMGGGGAHGMVNSASQYLGVVGFW